MSSGNHPQIVAHGETFSAPRRNHLRVVSADGSLSAPLAKNEQPVATTPATPKVSGTNANWDERHAVGSTYGEGPKKPGIEAGKIFSNAVNEYLAANPKATHLLAMAQEFEKAFVEAARSSAPN